MKRIVCFGEIMLRLNPPGYLRIKQANSFEASFAGGEANVAVSLANYGMEAAFVTRLPDNDLTTAALRTLRGYGVDVSHVCLGGERMGTYFVEKGASQRPSKVIYDRKYSAIATAASGDFDWDAIFSGADWFHFTGITPALSDGAAELCLEACCAAKARGVKVSCDLNYRGNLWSSEKAGQVMGGLMSYVDVCIANEEDAEKVFGIKPQDNNVQAGKINTDGYREVAQSICRQFGCAQVAITLRQSLSADNNNWSAMVYQDGKAYFAKTYAMHIVDRVGGGDSFGGGLIYALLSGREPQDAIEFATAASCLKHSIPFDFNQVTVKEVESLMGGDASGRVKR